MSWNLFGRWFMLVIVSSAWCFVGRVVPLPQAADYFVSTWPLWLGLTCVVTVMVGVLIYFSDRLDQRREQEARDLEEQLKEWSKWCDTARDLGGAISFTTIAGVFMENRHQHRDRANDLFNEVWIQAERTRNRSAPSGDAAQKKLFTRYVERLIWIAQKNDTWGYFLDMRIFPFVEPILKERFEELSRTEMGSAGFRNLSIRLVHDGNHDVSRSLRVLP